MFLLWLRKLPRCGDLTSASAPPPAKGRFGPTNTPVFSPSSFILLSFAWVNTFFSASQVLLSTLSCCSAHTSVSEGIFLVYLWREMCSTYTYSSTILFSECIFSNYTFVWIYSQEWSCSTIWPTLVFWGTSILFSIVAAPNLHCHQ